jgi:hypothetical protein
MLVTHSHVLTSAHCTTYKPKNEVQIIIGSVNILQGTIYYPFWWINFTQWCQFRKKRLQFRNNDIAIIKVRFPSYMLQKIQKIQKIETFKSRYNI